MRRPPKIFKKYPKRTLLCRTKRNVICTIGTEKKEPIWRIKWGTMHREGTFREEVFMEVVVEEEEAFRGVRFTFPVGRVVT
jgi:hypothetical protein